MGSISVFTKIPNLVKELRCYLPSVKFHEILSDKDERMRDSEIIIADFDLLAPALYELPNTKWVQGTWAGVDKLIPHIHPDKPLTFTITRYSGRHFGRIMGEYVLSHIINQERDYINVYNNQRSKTWTSGVAEILHKFGATIFGFGRKPNLDAKIESVVKKYYTKQYLGDFLKECDYIVNVLPNTDETRGLLNGGVLQSCKDRGSILINVGRGSIIKDEDLIEALDRKWLSAAILDVFNIEPLPENSPLWTMPQVRITPHVSAVSIARHIAEQFRDNYELYKNKAEIPTTLDLSKGY